MSNKEKQIIVSVIASVVILVIYSLVVYNRYLSGNPEALNDFRFWGKSFLIFIPVAIVAQIVIHILFAIVNKIITNEDLTDKEDERDKLIDLKGTKISHWIFTLGFLTAMGSQAIGMEPWVMFITLIMSGFVSSITGELAKIWFYQKGF